MTLLELADAADVSTRTVRYYIVQGLLPPPSGAGPAATYGEEHLLLLQAVKAMQGQHLPLAEIRGRLAGERAPPLPSPRQAGLGPIAPAGTPSAPPPSGQSALDYINRAMGRSPAPPPTHTHQLLPSSAPPVEPVGQRSTWERHQLTADIELHVRRPLQRDQQKRLDRLLDVARSIFHDPKGSTP